MGLCPPDTPPPLGRKLPSNFASILSDFLPHSSPQAYFYTLVIGSTDTQTDTKTDEHTHDTPKNDFFGLGNPQNEEIHQNLEVNFLDPHNTYRESKICFQCVSAK